MANYYENWAAVYSKGRTIIVIEIHFSINRTRYIIHSAGNYKEIIYEHDRRRVENQKAVCRDYGIDVSTDPNVMNTHQAIDLLIAKLVRDM
jgi:hypothetical protein